MTTSRAPNHKLAITLGDPAGIGPEIVGRTLSTLDSSFRRRLVVFGDTEILRAAFNANGHELPTDIELRDAGVARAAQVQLGAPNPISARAQVAYLEAAVRAALAGEVAGIVTAPISKAQAQSTGWNFPGHTEFLAARFGVPRVAMLFAGPNIRAVLTTVHVPIAKISSTLSVDRICGVIDLGVAALRADFAVTAPRIGVLGLNPHAGENGMFGDEEQRIITPAIEACARRHPEVSFVGPLPPDTAFRTPCDLFVAMYHDQALIPLKLHSFESVVNVTLGLPIVRTSPDHGVAYDIAGKGLANHRPFASALDLAANLVDNRARQGTLLTF